MHTTIENKIRFNAALIYFVVAVICAGMIVYVYQLRSNIDVQKENIEKYYNELLLTDRLISAINQTQSEANLYVITKRSNHLKQFRENLTNVEQLVDSLIFITRVPSHNDIMLEISVLLKEKGNIVSLLNRQFNIQNPLNTIDKKLGTYDPDLIADSVLVTTSIKDTIINIVPKKGFWDRLSDVFSPNSKKDTVLAITTLSIDTLEVFRTDSSRVALEMGEFAEQASEKYISQLAIIEDQVCNLLISDQEISSKITDLLVELYRRSIYLRLDEIQKSEEFIRKNNTYSIVSGVIALTLILVFILLIISDVNKGFTARVALQKANALTKKIMKSRHKLLLSVSHDIKTPLNSILGYLELSQNNKTLSQHDVDTMQNSGKHILALLENLLEFSSLEQGTVNAVPNDFNLHELCLETVEMFIPLARQKKLSFDFDFDFDEKLIIRSDSLKIKQIIINILSNSIKYTTNGGLRFNVSYYNNKLDFEITDTGVGIPKEQIRTLFRPFSRVEGNNPLAEGSGFGLYVVKGFVNLLKGEIVVDSEVNKGTKIRVLIPAKAVDVKNELLLKNILVIDDDQSFLMMIRDMLIRLGHGVTTLNSITEFNKISGDIEKYDAILTDMEMGISSGSDILTIVRNTAKHLPVVIMTAHDDFDYNMANEMGFDSYLRKPVTMSSLAHIFGGQDRLNCQHGLLEEMFDNDKDAIHEILMVFTHSTIENIEMLRQALSSDDFKTSQEICHKMLPMFMQIGAEDVATMLQKIDSLRSKSADSYPRWKDDITHFINKAEELIAQIREQYSLD